MSRALTFGVSILDNLILDNLILGILILGALILGTAISEVSISSSSISGSSRSSLQSAQLPLSCPANSYRNSLLISISTQIYSQILNACKKYKTTSV